MFCTKCGKQIKDGARFCAYCGAPQKIVSPASVPANQAAPAAQPVNTAPAAQPMNAGPEPQPMNTAPVQQPVNTAPAPQPVNAAPAQQPINAAPAPQMPAGSMETKSADAGMRPQDGPSDGGKKSASKGSWAIIIAALIVGLAVVAAALLFVLRPQNGKPTDAADSVTVETEQTVSEEETESEEETGSEETSAEPEETSTEEETTVSAEQQEMESWFSSLASRNTSNAYASEADMLATYKLNSEQYIKDGRFEEARDELTRWENLLEAIEGQGSYEMEVEQVDVTEFPIIKVYVRIQDKVTEVSVNALTESGFTIYEKVEGEGDFVGRTVKRALQLNNKASLNTVIVADVSDSMNLGQRLMSAKSAMTEFVNNLQPAAGDMASLISFADEVYCNMTFSSDFNALRNAINGLNTNNLTALYDALYLALGQVSAQDGAKCVIAFTDGNDNNSSCSAEIVAQRAEQLNIPVFIIGIEPDWDTSELVMICNRSGGFYRDVYEISSMSEIYEAIYREQKELYLIEYETQQQEATDVARNLNLDYVDDNIVVRSEYRYVPQVYLEATVSMAQMFVNDFIIYDSDRRFVTVADLARLNREQLRLARNEIYARKGRKFTSTDLQAYFNSKSWYRGTIEASAFNEAMLNEYERTNAYFIKSYEEDMGFYPKS